MGKNRVVFDFFPGDEELLAAEFHRIDCCNLYLVLASLLPHCTTDCTTTAPLYSTTTTRTYLSVSSPAFVQADETPELTALEGLS